MSAKPFLVNLTSGLTAHHTRVSLVPLLTDGPAALAPDDASGVLNMAFSGVVYCWHNAFNEVVSRRADDLFACAAKEGKYSHPVPKGADVIQATFDVRFAGCAEPHAMSIAPPDTLTFQSPEDAARILPLLARRGFSAATQEPTANGH